MGPFESDPIVCDKSLNSTVLGLAELLVKDKYLECQILIRLNFLNVLMT